MSAVRRAQGQTRGILAGRGRGEAQLERRPGGWAGVSERWGRAGQLGHAPRGRGPAPKSSPPRAGMNARGMAARWRFASRVVWPHRRPVGPVPRPPWLLGNRQPLEGGSQPAGGRSAMDLVITQELAHAESQQGGRGPRPSALPRGGPVPPGSEFPPWQVPRPLNPPHPSAGTPATLGSSSRCQTHDPETPWDPPSPAPPPVAPGHSDRVKPALVAFG